LTKFVVTRKLSWRTPRWEASAMYNFCCRIEDDIRATEQLAAYIQRLIPYESPWTSTRQSPAATVGWSRDCVLRATGEWIYAWL